MCEEKTVVFSPFSVCCVCISRQYFHSLRPQGGGSAAKTQNCNNVFLAEINFIPLMSALLHVLFSCSHMSQKYVHCIPLLQHFHTRSTAFRNKVRILHTYAFVLKCALLIYDGKQPMLSALLLCKCKNDCIVLSVLVEM